PLSLRGPHSVGAGSSRHGAGGRAGADGVVARTGPGLCGGAGGQAGVRASGDQALRHGRRRAKLRGGACDRAGGGRRSGRHGSLPGGREAVSLTPVCLRRRLGSAECREGGGLITVYGASNSGNCWKVAQVLTLVGQPYRWVETDPNAGATRTAAFLARNP